MQRVLAIVLCWRDEDDAWAQCRRLIHWRRVRPRVCLVRNASSGTSPREEGVTVVDLPRNQGYAGGINAGIRALRPDAGDLILLLNNDVHVDEDAVRTLALHLDTHPGIGVIGPVLEEGRRFGIGGRDPLRFVATRRTLPSRPGPGPPLDTDYVPGTVLLFRGEITAAVGLLDERFFFSGEMADFCRRVWERGLRCAVAPDVCARHVPADPDGMRLTLYRYYTLRNRFLMARKRSSFRWPIWATYWTGMGLLMALKTVRRRPAASRAVLWALADGWRGRFGNRHERFAC